MIGKNITFDDKKIRKSTFYKNKTTNNIEEIDINNILVSKKNHMVQKIQLNTLLDIIIIILLDYCDKTSTNDWIC